MSLSPEGTLRNLIKKILILLTIILISQQVEVRGLKAISINDIAGYIPSKITKEKLEESLKLLAKTGWFKELSYYQDKRTGKVILVVEEKEIVRTFSITGIKDKDKLIEELAEFKLRSYFDVQDQVKEVVRKFLDKKGYAQSKIDISWENDTKTVQINVNKGPRIKIKEIKIDISDKSLKRAIYDILSSREYKWWSSWLTGSGYYSKTLIEEDNEKLKNFLQQKGYFDATIQAQENITRNLAYINFLITLGERYTLGSIPEGVENLKSGEKFNGLEVKQALDKITSFYKDQGYAFVNVVPNLKVDRENKVVDLEITIQKGEVQRINQIKIQGNTKTRDRVLRRDLRIVEGEVFNVSKLERSKTRLLRTGLFSDVKYEVFKTPNKENFVDVNFVVKETQTGSLSVGAGYSTLDDFFGSLRFTETNVFGTAIKFLFTGYFGREFNSFNLKLSEPRILDSFYQGSIEAFRNRRDFDDFKRYQTGSRLSLGYDFENFESLKDFSAKLYLDFRKVKIDDVSESAASFIKDSKGKGNDLSTGFEIKRLGVDKITRPTKGSAQSFSFEYSGFSSDFNYFNFGLSNQVFYPVYEFEEGGVIVLMNKTALDYGKGLKGERYPLHKRFFPGGSKTNRGYKPRSMGPREANSEFGGSKQVFNNIELIVPVVNDIGLDFVLFFDIGEAFDDSKNIHLSDLRKGYGGGFRWNSPAGPLSLEFGSPLDKREGDKSLVVNFSLGMDF